MFVKPSKKWLTIGKELAYCAKELIATVKSFMIQALMSCFWANKTTSLFRDFSFSKVSKLRLSNWTLVWRTTWTRNRRSATPSLSWGTWCPRWTTSTSRSCRSWKSLKSCSDNPLIRSDFLLYFFAVVSLLSRYSKTILRNLGIFPYRLEYRQKKLSRIQTDKF